jgi:hypothetical protein
MKPKIFTFFDMALAMKASDLLLKPGAPPTFRQNRHLIISEEEPLAPQEMYDLFLPVLDSRQQSRLNSTFEAHGMYPYKRKARVRYYIFQQREGFAGSFRFIPTHVPTIQELQLPEVLIEVAAAPVVSSWSPGRSAPARAIRWRRWSMPSTNGSPAISSRWRTPSSSCSSGNSRSSPRSRWAP